MNLRRFYKVLAFLTFLMLISVDISAQENKKIQLLGAEKLIGIEKRGVDLQVLDGNVKLKHGNTLFYCDSAVRTPAKNSFKAYQNVHIIVNDSIDIYSDSLYYDGNTRIGELYGDVKLVDEKATLYTDYLIYDRNTKIGKYITWGRIEDSENELTSNVGYYYSDSHEAYFRDSVVVNTPDYMMYGDTLMYNTQTEVAYIYGPTNIIGEKDSVYCEWGWYDTQNDIANLKMNVFIRHLEQSIEADTVYYEKHRGFGEAFNNITISDTVQDALVKGNYARYLKADSNAFVTDSAHAIFIDNRDSLFLHADTLKVKFDTANQAERIFAFNKVKFFRDDLQGASDSLVYDINDSLIRMYKKPVLWADQNQLTADSIQLAVSNNELDSIVFYGNSFIISKDDSGSYNQIRGKNMIGYFADNQLYKLRVLGNAETIYFIRDDESGDLIGVNKIISSDMLVFMENRELSTITWITKPVATTYPPGELQPQDLKIRGFSWMNYQRPAKKTDIFNWNEASAPEKSESEQ